jgi:hypothetical protein
MFEWFKKPGYSNVLPFPESKVSPTSPYIKPPEKSTPDEIYSIGVTGEGTHMTFRVGYTTLTMTKLGCEQLIEQLELFKNQLQDHGQKES